MSFSSSIKSDLTRLRVRGRGAKLSQLSGLTKSCGSLSIKKSGRAVLYKTESLPVGKHIAFLATSLFGVDAAIELSRRERRENYPLTLVTLTGEAVGALLVGTGVLDERGAFLFDAGAPEALVCDEDTGKAFLRGAFLGSGSVNDPARGYHLEIVARTGAFADSLLTLLAGFSVAAGRSERRGREIVYVKGAHVAAFLALIGASSGALAFESARTEKDFRNYVNRTSNCETANIGKTVNASLLQIRAIERIERVMDLAALPEPLYEAARLRLKYPDATLTELADLAEIGKSGMNHRLARLIRIAEDLGEE